MNSSSDPEAADRLEGGNARAFVTTRWSVVLSARQDHSPEASAALEGLCRAYWFPLYAFVRRRGHAPHDAEDLTQEFFHRLIERRYLHAVDHRKGRFRTFLLAALEHFLANEWRRSRAQRRGGGQTPISIDEAAEQWYEAAVAAGGTPERIYERRWALAFLDRVIGRLRAEMVSAGRGVHFDVLKPALTGDRLAGGYAALAVRLETSEAAVKMAISRLRQRYGELLREEITETVADPAEVEDELRALLAALG